MAMQPFVVLRNRGELFDLGMKWQVARDVIVHNHDEEHQEEHQPHLHEAFFERQAEVPPPEAFQREQQNISAIQNWYREQVQNAQVQADHGHQIHHFRRPLMHSLSCLAGYAHDPLQLIDRDPS